MRARDFLQENDEVESPVDDSTQIPDEKKLMIPATQQALELVKAKLDPDRIKNSPVLQQMLHKKKLENDKK